MKDVVIHHFITAAVQEIIAAIDANELVEQDEKDALILEICVSKLKKVSELIRALYVMEKLTHDSAIEFYNYVEKPQKKRKKKKKKV